MSFLAAFIDRQFIHYPPTQTNSFESKTVIVTGASSGLGLEACRRIVQLGAAKVIIACRNNEKGLAALNDIQSSTSCHADTIAVWTLDMSSYASVITFADRAKAELPRLDAVIANAGIGTRTFNMTEDNEETITTNVVSTALLAFLLHPKLRDTATKYKVQTHLTLTGSELYEVAAFKESQVPDGKIFATLNDPATANMNDRYNVSKLLDAFIVKEIAALSPVSESEVIVNIVAPGLCHSELHRQYAGLFIVRVILRIVARPTEVGSRTLVFGASAGADTHGQYLPDCKIKQTLGLCKGDKGILLQARVMKELMEKLEAIRAGSTCLV